MGSQLTEAPRRYNPERLHELLEAQGVRGEWVAEQLGIDQSYISKLRYGDKPLTDSLVAKLARLFRVPVSYFTATQGVKE